MKDIRYFLFIPSKLDPEEITADLEDMGLKASADPEGTLVYVYSSMAATTIIHLERLHGILSFTPDQVTM